VATVTAGRLSTFRLGLPFVAVHLGCLAVLVVGWSPVAVAVAVALYATRAFGITAWYHRCLAHRAFRASRPVQFAGAVLGASAAQLGPLWWAAHHRVHHQHTDRPGDPHSPRVLGTARGHVLWIFDPANRATDIEHVPDLAALPELRLLDRCPHVVPVLTAAATFGLGALLARAAPGLGTSGPQMLVWGFCVSTAVLYHVTFSVNSVGHRLGRRRYETTDDSRNNSLLALLALGEGWHNNHHRFPGAARQGFAWWELDLTWLVLRGLQAFGLVQDLRPAPAAVLDVATRGHRSATSGRM
jgi:stearoyl-CoA desaturase (delta-9 desaturase)